VPKPEGFERVHLEQRVKLGVVAEPEAPVERVMIGHHREPGERLGLQTPVPVQEEPIEALLECPPRDASIAR